MSTIVFSFGRFNPPTKGHEKLIAKVISTSKQHNADHIIYLSQTTDNSSNPLSWDFKRRVCAALFSSVNISKDKNIKSPYIALEHLKDSYSKIILVAGEDRVDEYISRFTPYAEMWGIEFKVVSAGKRSKYSTGVSGISGTKMRQYAKEGNKSKFYNGLPGVLGVTAMSLIYENTKKGLRKTR